MHGCAGIEEFGHQAIRPIESSGPPALQKSEMSTSASQHYNNVRILLRNVNGHACTIHNGVIFCANKKQRDCNVCIECKETKNAIIRNIKILVMLWLALGFKKRWLQAGRMTFVEKGFRFFFFSLLLVLDVLSMYLLLEASL